MFDRRDFLKLFGVGSTIAPLAAGVLIPDVTARLVEPAKVELIEPKLAAESLNPLDVGEAELTQYLMTNAVEVDMTVTVRRDNIKWHVRGHGYLRQLSSRSEFIDITSLSNPNPWPHYIMASHRFRWKVEGVFTALHGVPIIS